MKIRSNPKFPVDITQLSRELGVLWRELASSVNSIYDQIKNNWHGGVTREINVHPKSFGAVGNGTTDDVIAIQEAIDYAETYGYILDGEGLTYAISSKLTVGGSLAIVFQNINLVAITGTWPSGVNGSMLYITEPTNFEDNYHSFQNVNCNANDFAKTGFLVSSVQAKASFIDCNTWFFSEYGFWIKGTGDGNNDVRFIGCTSSERLWTADTGDAFHVYADRTAYAWYIDYSADCEFIDCVGYGSKRALVIDNGPYNNQFTGCKFWSGPVRTESTSITVEIIDGQRCQFIGCRFDDGAVVLKTFNNQFIGCLFIQFDANAQLQLEATSASQTAAGFQLLGCKFSGSSPTALTTSGSGSWASNLLVTTVGNLTSTGSTVTLNSLQYQSGSVKYADGQYTFGNGYGTEIISLDGAAATYRLFNVKTNNSIRWAWGVDDVSEAGSDAGSNWGLNYYDDSGSYAGNSIYVYRATGNININKPITFNPGSSAPALNTNGHVIFELTNNTTLTFKARGSDGTTRSGTVTLA